MQGMMNSIIIKSTKPGKLFYQQYLREDIKEDSSSDEDSVKKLISDEIYLIRMRRHLKQKKAPQHFQESQWFVV
jgi:hypothetical protein